MSNQVDERTVKSVSAKYPAPDAPKQGHIAKKKLIAYVKWISKNEYSCMCSFFNPLCNNHKECEELEVEFNPYEGIEECMRQRSYKREKGALKQK